MMRRSLVFDRWNQVRASWYAPSTVALSRLKVVWHQKVGYPVDNAKIPKMFWENQTKLSANPSMLNVTWSNLRLRQLFTCAIRSSSHRTAASRPSSTRPLSTLPVPPSAAPFQILSALECHMKLWALADELWRICNSVDPRDLWMEQHRRDVRF